MTNGNSPAGRMGQLRSEELDSVAGGETSFSVGFVDITYYGKSPYGDGLGPMGDGVGIHQVWTARSANHRIQAF